MGSKVCRRRLGHKFSKTPRMTYRSPISPSKTHGFLFSRENPPISQATKLSPLGRFALNCSLYKIYIGFMDNRSMPFRDKPSRNKSNTKMNIKFFHSIPYVDAKVVSQISKREDEIESQKRELNSDIKFDNHRISAM